MYRCRRPGDNEEEEEEEEGGNFCRERKSFCERSGNTFSRTARAGHFRVARSSDG